MIFDIDIYITGKSIAYKKKVKTIPFEMCGALFFFCQVMWVGAGKESAGCSWMDKHSFATCFCFTKHAQT